MKSGFSITELRTSLKHNAGAEMILYHKSHATAHLFLGYLLLTLLVGCKKQPPHEDKALRMQLTHELRHHSYETALPIARRLVELTPQDNSAWKRLAQAHLKLHDLDAVADTLTEWRTTVAAPAPRLTEYEGDLANETHHSARAREAWKKVVSLQPKNRRVLRKIARLEQSQQHWAEAIAAWSQLLKVQDDAVGWVNLAACQRRLHDWDHAFQDWHRAQHLAPDDPDVRRWSKVFERLSKFLDQIRELDAKVVAAPNDAGLHADRALMLLRSGDPELALDDCEMASALAPWAVRPRLFRAVALIGLDRAAECERLSIRQPFQLEMLTPEFLETMSRLDSAISVEGNNPDHFVARSWQLNEIGQPMLALQDAEKAARLDRKSANACAEISYSLTKLGRTKEAFEKIKQATELDPNLPSAWQYRGELEMAEENNLAAIESFSRALAIEKTAAGLQKREECYRRVGLSARAEEDHRALQELTAGTLK
jgi:tetratricopeptide (TPR) repeat protein